jgi:hypothetical protein
MSDRPTAVNGKRSRAWGTTSACPECGECLCFACHPKGPCIDEHASDAGTGAGCATAGEGYASNAWALPPSSGIGVAGLHLRAR